MRHLLIRWGILTVAVAVAAWLVDGIDVHGGVPGYLAVGLVLGLVNALVRPIVRLFSLPITVATLGLFSLVINAIMLLLAAALSSVLSIDRFWEAFVGALVISIVSAILNAVVTRREPSRR